MAETKTRVGVIIFILFKKKTENQNVHLCSIFDAGACFALASVVCFSMVFHVLLLHLYCVLDAGLCFVLARMLCFRR